MLVATTYARREIEDAFERQARMTRQLHSGFKLSRAKWDKENGLELLFDEVEPAEVDEDAGPWGD
jgi:hypothetical protein